MPDVPNIDWNENGVELMTLTETDEQRFKQTVSFFEILEVDNVGEGVVKQLWEADFNVDDLNIPNPELKSWIQERIQAFDDIERQLNVLVGLLQQAKQDTIRKYSQNPSFEVIYGTDMAKEYLNDLIELFKN